MAEIVYTLCALTSATCAALLLRSYRQSGHRLLLWSGLCFVGLALHNALMFIDFVLVPATDLGMIRQATAVSSMGLLLYGLVWEAR